MKLRNLFWGAVASLAVFAACDEPEQNLGTPDIKISETEMTFDAAGGDQSLTVTATRDWMVETDADWVVVSPESGSASLDPQSVVVSVLENTGLDRTADLVFTIGLKKKYLTVNQAGPGGSAEALVIYKNDFDIEKAQNNSGWPYLDSNYNLWDNKKGTGASTVIYEFGGKMSVRTSGKASNDGSGYSHYAGSGANKIFFGAATSILKINKITLDGAKTDFTLSFGGQKYLQDGDSNFSWAEFKVYVSNDAQKWVELAMSFPADADINGDWNLASANFTVPAGTTELGIAFVSTASSAYSIDDVLLEVGAEAGQTIDFSAGVAIDGTTGGDNGGNNGGDTPTPPAGEATMTIAEVLAYGAALPSDAVIEGVVISNMDLNNLTSKKGMYVQDATAALQFYLAENHSFAMGDKVQINLAGVSVGEYNGAVQISGLALSKIAKVSSGNTVTPKTVTMADFLANKYEGQYIALEGVQVVAADMSKTFVMDGAHTSINMEDASGNTFVVFSSKYSTYGSQTVPQGSGVIKGISSISNGAMQIIFSQASDYAGLTGTRFDGIEVTPPSGGDEGGETPTPPAGDPGDFDSSITWTLGNKAYDNTSGSNAQYGTVNGVSVDNMLKLGTGSLVGDATLHVPAGTTKLGFYCVAWKGKKADLKFSIGGTEVTTISPAANAGATGNPPYTITLADSDYYEVTMPSTAAADVKVETLDNSNGRVIIIGIKPIQ